MPSRSPCGAGSLIPERASNPDERLPGGCVSEQDRSGSLQLKADIGKKRTAQQAVRSLICVRARSV
jgi:hypothetical protein